MENLEQKLTRKLGALILLSTLGILMFSMIYAKSDYNPNIATFYTSAGKINQPTRVWDGIITPTTGSGMSVDISSAAFTSINSVTVTAANNTGTTTSMPFASIKSYTNSAVLINILQSNSQVIGVLGVAVNGLITPTALTGMTIHVRVDGW